MTIVWKANRTYEGRSTDTDYADTLDEAKALARNWVYLDQPVSWTDETPEWKEYLDQPTHLSMDNLDNDTEITIERIET